MNNLYPPRHKLDDNYEQIKNILQLSKNTVKN